MRKVPPESSIRAGEPGSGRRRACRKRGVRKARLRAPLVGRGGGTGAADGAVRVATLRRVELLSKVCVGVGEEVFREALPRLIAPVHASEFVNVEIAGA